MVVAEAARHTVGRVFLVFLNNTYERDGPIEPDRLFSIEDITRQARELETGLTAQIRSAMQFQTLAEIDLTSCSCLGKTRANHCDTFAILNPDVPTPSIYTLPGIRASAVTQFATERRFDLSTITEAEVNARQALVLRSAQTGMPVIDYADLARFFKELTYPLYFLDYEAFGAALPRINGARPHQQIPFQFSLHVKETPTAPAQHAEYLAETLQMPLEMIEALEAAIGPTGSVISWHMSYENGQNDRMAAYYPQKEQFLNDLSARTVDLEKVFHRSYVDIAFMGSTSIKKVLPVVVPDLKYDGLAISNGTDAMTGWDAFIQMQDGPEKDRQRQDLLEYCKLDTLAMVRIFETLQREI